MHRKRKERSGKKKGKKNERQKVNVFKELN